MTGGYRSPTAFWLGGAGNISSDTTRRHPRGRQGLWYAQPHAGVNYPLVLPSDDIKYLIADIFLSYDDPSTYTDTEAFTLPFHIHWVYGLNGSVVDDLDELAYLDEFGEDTPVPVHNQDIIIHDADNRVVFDSTAIDVEYVARDWTDWLSITRWCSAAGSSCSIVYHTAWSDDDTPTPEEPPLCILPVAAVLQENTVYRLPKRVKSLTVALDNLTATNVSFNVGYNMQMTAAAPVTVDGSRRVTSITMDAEAGAGIGVYPGCTEPELVIRSINSIQPTAVGNFFLNSDACYYVRQPVVLLSTTPRELLPAVHLSPGNIAEDDLPAAEAGTTTDAAGWPADEVYAHLKIGNDCTACCDCTDYVAVAQYMSRQHAKYAAAAAALNAARDMYHDNRERWLTTRTCLQTSPVRLLVQAQQCPYIDIGIQVCNQSNNCISDIQITVTVSVLPSGAAVGRVVDGYTFITGPVAQGGIQRTGTQRGVIADTWPDFVATIPQLQPASTGSVRFRLAISNCGQSDTSPVVVSAVANAIADGVFLNAIPVTDNATLNCPASAANYEQQDACIEC